jgi:hypothetical protein
MYLIANKYIGFQIIIIEKLFLYAVDRISEASKASRGSIEENLTPRLDRFDFFSSYLQPRAIKSDARQSRVCEKVNAESSQSAH